MKIIETSIVIQASADHVWSILTDLDGYVNWNPFIISAKGSLVVGQPLQLRRATDINTALYHGTVTVVNVEGYTLSWRMHLITSALLNTVYTFTIEPQDTESVRFTQRETLSGLISKVFRRDWLHTLQSRMVAESKALKRLAENKPHLLPQFWTTSA